MGAEAAEDEAASIAAATAVAADAMAFATPGATALAGVPGAAGVPDEADALGLRAVFAGARAAVAALAGAGGCGGRVFCAAASADAAGAAGSWAVFAGAEAEAEAVSAAVGWAVVFVGAFNGLGCARSVVASALAGATSAVAAASSSTFKLSCWLLGWLLCWLAACAVAGWGVTLAWAVLVALALGRAAWAVAFRGVWGAAVAVRWPGTGLATLADWVAAALAFSGLRALRVAATGLTASSKSAWRGNLATRRAMALALARAREEAAGVAVDWFMPELCTATWVLAAHKFTDWQRLGLPGPAHPQRRDARHSGLAAPDVGPLHEAVSGIDRRIFGVKLPILPCFTRCGDCPRAAAQT
jgi:hypothetical protein